MKVKISWQCQYSDFNATWDEKRSRVLAIDGAECIVDEAIKQIVQEYQNKYQCFGQESCGVYIFADELDCVIISDFNVERVCE